MPPKAAKAAKSTDLNPARVMSYEERAQLEPEVGYSAEEIEELEAQEQRVPRSPAQEREIERMSRAEIALSTEFGLSLFGSWALYHDRDTTKQGLIVAEPQEGIYLLELYDLVADAPVKQVLIELKELVGVGDEGGTWSFYDDRKSIRKAIVGLMA